MFWLGVHRVGWLASMGVPLMVSARSLAGRRVLPRGSAPWFQDSGGFTELDKFGRFDTAPRDYARATIRHAEEIGRLHHAAIQDWMCEPQIVAKTGLSIEAHQRKTVESWLELNSLAPELPWLPVLQGWDFDDYRRHVDMYAAAGVDLLRVPLVGLGTVCRRQNMVVAARIVGGLSALGLRLHAFGFKVTGIVRTMQWLSSTDSMSWSLDGRMPKGGRCSPVRNHRSCANCSAYALRWREGLMRRLSQQVMWEGVMA